MQSRKVLVIDDTKDVRNTLAGVLTDAGYLVKTANNEKEAIKAVSIDKYGFIVIDVRLEGNDDEDRSGMDLVGTIRAMGMKSHIILITGKRVKGTHFKDAKEYNVLAYIEKNVDWVTEVLNTIKDTPPVPSFDVFLCHNHEDKPAVKIVAKKLEAQGIKPWLDEWELRPGRPWQEELEKQIEYIPSAAVFIGEKGIGPWQSQELNAFLREFADRNCPVIPVILDIAPKKPKLPIFLRSMTWVDFRKSSPDPIKQLIWGITGKKDR